MPRLNHFDFLAPLYDRLFSAPQDSPLAPLLELPCSGLLLDVGGGTGRVAQNLTGLVDQVVIADASRRMLARARTKPGLQAVMSLAEGLPLATGSAARVISVDAYHHLADQRLSLREMWRALAPNGVLVIEEPDIAHWAVRLVALGEKMLMMRSHFVSGERLAVDLDALGAQVTIVREQFSYYVLARKNPRFLPAA